MITLYDRDGKKHEIRDELVHELMLTGAYTREPKFVSKSEAKRLGAQAKTVKKTTIKE